MRQRILLIGYNFYPEPTGIGKYSGEMMQWLAEQGHECSVITAYPYYPYWKVQEPYFKRRFTYHTEVTAFESGGKLTLHRCPMYVPTKPSGLKRLLLDVSFLLTASLKVGQHLLSQRFNTVITVAPSFQFGLLGVFYKVFRRTRLVYHIQDMQIEAARDLGMVNARRMLDFLFIVERFIFRRADIISTISEEMSRRIKLKANTDVYLFPNWTDTQQFYPLKTTEHIKTTYGFQPHDKIVLYSGAIGEKQGLEAILYSAQFFQKQQDIMFIICGSGPYKSTLEQLASDLQLNNVSFLPLQPVDRFNQFLNLADVHLVLQKANASDSVMPSKLTTILSVGGLALVTANAGSGLYTLIGKHNLALVVEAENQESLNKGLQKALAEDNSLIRRSARTYAENYLSKETIMRSFEAKISR